MTRQAADEDATAPVMEAWAPASAASSVGSTAVQIYRASLQASAAELARRVVALSPIERSRAEAFTFERDRRCFVVARSTLRGLLAKELGVDPRDVPLTQGAFEKPALTGTAERAGLDFNVSHSGDLALFSLARGRAVGVDLELVATDRDLDALARAALSSWEHDRWLATPEPRRGDVFHALWTCKEAVVKALGVGFSVSPRDFSVDVWGRDPRLHDSRSLGTQPRRWSLRSVPVHPGYAAALAFDGAPASVERYHVGPDDGGLAPPSPR